MATTPAFASTIRVASGIVDATLDTSLTAPTHILNLMSGVAAGTKIEEIVFMGLLTTVAGVINVFLYDGATYHLYDQVLVPVVTSGATTLAFRRVKQYDNLIIPGTAWSLRFTQTIAGNQSGFKITATGADLT